MDGLVASLEYVVLVMCVSSLPSSESPYITRFHRAQTVING